MFDQNLKRLDMKEKYTDGGKSSKDSGGNRMGKDWDVKDIKRFNELCALVQMDRKANHALEFENKYLSHRIRTKEFEAKKVKEVASKRVPR